MNLLLSDRLSRTLRIQFQPKVRKLYLVSQLAYTVCLSNSLQKTGVDFIENHAGVIWSKCDTNSIILLPGYKK